MLSLSSPCPRCGGPLDETGRSWVFEKPQKHEAIVRVCSACSGSAVRTCLLCNGNPAMPGLPICAACEDGI